MQTAMNRLSIWLQIRAAEARERAVREADHGEVVEKVIIVAAAAAMAIAVMAAISAAVDIKVAGLKL